MTAADDNLLRCLFQTVNVLAENAAARETFGRGHQPRCAQIARTLAQLYGLDRNAVDGVRVSATLHDHGRIFLPLEILNKPGPLTPEEYEIIKQHPLKGYEALQGIEFPWPVAQAVLQHHERLDGSGYPHGLRGNDIILEARIVMVADVMDAMTSDKPWRKAMPAAEALAELSKGAGTLYDQSVVDVCIELYTKQAHRLDPEYYGRDD